MKVGFESYVPSVDPVKSTKSSLFNLNNDCFKPAKYSVPASEYYKGQNVDLEDEQEMPSISEMVPIFDPKETVVVQMYQYSNYYS